MKEKKNMTTIVVTGGAGYIGSHIVLDLLDSGFEVVVMDNLSTGFERLIDKRAIFERCDIGDCDAVRVVIDRHQPSGVIHLAAFSNVSESMKNPDTYYRNNVVASAAFLAVLQEKNITNIVFSSSAAVFGNVAKEQIPITEACPKNPINPYGESKLATEKTLAQMGKLTENFRFVILRYFNACGADAKLRSGECHNPETHLIPLAIKAAMGKTGVMTINGDDFNTPDGTCIRDYIHVSDLSQIHVQALQYLLQGGKSDDFNCGYNKGFSVKQIIDAVKQETKTDFKTVIGKRRQGDPATLIANNKKLKKRLGFQPQYDDLKVIIQTAYAWECV